MGSARAGAKNLTERGPATRHPRRRYFVLTRKGLHYYVRKQDAGDHPKRDLFGEHEGSIALGNIARVDLVSEEYRRNLTFLVVSKAGGRKFYLRAGTAELYQRWVGTLQAALDPQFPSMSSRSHSGSRSSVAGTGSSFPRIPTLLDFRSPPRTDNLANVTLFSSSLGLEVRSTNMPPAAVPRALDAPLTCSLSAPRLTQLLLESGLPWGVQTTVERRRHRVTCALAASTNHVASSDVLRLFLEGGASASIPLARTLLRRPVGSAIVSLQGSSLHKAVKLTWEAEAGSSEAPQHTLPRARVISYGRFLLTAAATLAGALVLLLPRLSPGPIPPAAIATESAAIAPQRAGLTRASVAEPAAVAVEPPSGDLRTWLLTCGAIAFAAWTYLDQCCSTDPRKRRRRGPSSGVSAAGTAVSWPSWLPSPLLRLVPKPLTRAMVTACQPRAWRLSFEPASVDRDAQASGNHAGGEAPSSTAHPSHAQATVGGTGATGAAAHARGLENLDPKSPARTAQQTPDGELQVDALFADVASQEHSLLHHAALALRQAAQRSPYLSGKAEAYPMGEAADEAAAGTAHVAVPPAAPVADGVPDLHLESMLRAFELAVIQVLSSLGPAMLILVKNDQANLRKVRDAAAAAAANSSDGRVSQSIRALLEDELSRGMHAPGDVIMPGAAAADGAVGGPPSPAGGRSSAGGGASSSPFPPTTIGHSVIGCTGGATLYDPSAAISLLWLRRTLNFTLIIMENLLHAKVAPAPPRHACAHRTAPLPNLASFSSPQLYLSSPRSPSPLTSFTPQVARDDNETLDTLHLLDDQAEDAEAAPFGDPVAEAVRDGYGKTVRPFHSWLLRKTFDLVSTQLPSLNDTLLIMGPGLGDAEREGKVWADIRMYVEEGRPVAAALDAIFVELKLEDLRQV